MIRNTQVLWPTLGAVTLAVALAGCGGNTPAENAAGTASSGTTTSQTTETTTSDTAASGGESTMSEAPSELAAFFPGATLTKKAFPLSADDAAHMSGESGVKFSGKEKDWEVYEASQNGARAGYAVMTHADLPGGGDMHAMFAVDKGFRITKTDVSGAPNEAKMKQLVAQATGKTLSAKWKVGQDIKPVTGVAQADAQVAADALKKGLVILDNNFNAAHGAHTSGAASGASGHSHEAGQTEGDGHAH